MKTGDAKWLPLGLALTGLLSAATPGPSAAAASRSGIVTLEVDLTAQEPGAPARLWIPYPVSDRNQLVRDAHVGGDYTTAWVGTDRRHGTPTLYAEWSQGAPTRKLSLSFVVERDEVTRRDLPAAEPAWNPGDYGPYLQPTSLGPLDGKVRELSATITSGKRTVLEKARAIYDWTVENMYRDPDTKGCGKGDVCALLRKPGGKCTDISSVYVALCRAAGVPAREVFGLRLGKKAEEDVTTWQHCWVEVFLPGCGWFAVDPADVRKAMLVEKLDLGDPKTKEYREYFWGNVDACRVALAQGRDLVLNPPQAGAPLNTFGYPYAEVGGRPLDCYDPKTFVYTYRFREVPEAR
ncbi:MAG TPA: transglutaminase domain-containing protein [bacterium]